MRVFYFAAAVAALTLTASAHASILPGAPAAPDPFTINFDENGHASVSVFGGSSYTETGYMHTSQFAGNLGISVLTYDLPENIGPGGVNISDASGAISDNLFFYNDANGGHMEYYSQAGGGDLADTGVFDFGFSGATETASDTFSFVAGSGDPSTTNFYDGVSGNGAQISSPEPATMTMLGMGVLTLVGYRRRMRKVAA